MRAQSLTLFVVVLLTWAASALCLSPEELLVIAAQSGDRRNVERALDQGVATDGRFMGDSPLTAAAQNGHIKIVRILIEAGADIDERNISGRSALMAAADAGQLEVVRLLLEKGARVDIRDGTGSTALDLAKKYPRIVALLQAPRTEPSQDKAEPKLELSSDKDLGISPERVRLEFGHLFTKLEAGEAVKGLDKHIAMGRDKMSILEIYSREGQAVEIVLLVPAWPGMSKEEYQAYVANLILMAQVGISSRNEAELSQDIKDWVVTSVVDLLKTARIKRVKKQPFWSTDKVAEKSFSGRRLRMSLPFLMLALTVSAEAEADGNQ